MPLKNIPFESLGSLSRDDFYILLNGKIVSDWSTLGPNDPFQVCLRVLGGKGGFGSLLRSFRIYRSTNQDMCRDLTGRRVKDVKKEEKLKKFIEKKAEREREKEKKRQEKYERLKAGPPKHDFNDTEYQKAKEDILEKTDDALEQGLKAAAVSAIIEDHTDQPGPSGLQSGERKRAANGTSAKKEAPAAKKPKADVWLGIEGLDDVDFSGSGSEEDESPSASTSSKR